MAEDPSLMKDDMSCHNASQMIQKLLSKTWKSACCLIPKT